MKHRNSEEFVDSLVVRDIGGRTPDFDADDIAFVRDNPQVLAQLADPMEVKKRYIYVLFAVALTIAVISKVIEYTGIVAADPVASDLVTNVTFAVSIELFGAAVVAYLMELVFERRVKRNQALVQDLLHRAEETQTSPQG
jgi:hypothetical protein